MMSAGSMQVRILVTGATGEATVSIPVPAVAIATLQMKRGPRYSLWRCSGSF